MIWWLASADNGMFIFPHPDRYTAFCVSFRRLEVDQMEKDGSLQLLEVGHTAVAARSLLDLDG